MEIYCSIVERKVIKRANFPDLTRSKNDATAFLRSSAQRNPEPFDWRYTSNDQNA